MDAHLCREFLDAQPQSLPKLTDSNLGVIGLRSPGGRRGIHLLAAPDLAHSSHQSWVIVLNSSLSRPSHPTAWRGRRLFCCKYTTNLANAKDLAHQKP